MPKCFPTPVPLWNAVPHYTKTSSRNKRKRPRTEGLGKQVVERLAEDLQKEFPATVGFLSQTSDSCAVFIWGGRRRLKNSHSL
jgi:hypothetical protein